MRTLRKNGLQSAKGPSSEYDAHLKALCELAGVFSNELESENPAFRQALGRILSRENSYTTEVRLGTDFISPGGTAAFYEKYDAAKGAANRGKRGLVYVAAPYFATLSRFLASVYGEASHFFGPTKTRTIFRKSLRRLKTGIHALPDLGSYLPAGVVKPAAKAGLSASYSIVLEESMMDYLIHTFVEPLRVDKKDIPAGTVTAIKSALAQMAIAKKQDLGKQDLGKHDHVRLYLILEDIVVNLNPGDPKCGSRDVFRAHIASRFNTQWFRPRLKALFTPVSKDADTLVLYELLLESVLKNVTATLGQEQLNAALRRITGKRLLDGLMVKNGEIDFSIPEQMIFTDEQKYAQAIGELSGTLSAIHAYCKSSIGDVGTHAVFKSAFNEVERVYGKLPQFMHLMRVLASGIFESEKHRILNPVAHASAEAISEAVELLAQDKETATAISSFSERIEECERMPFEEQPDAFFRTYSSIEDRVLYRMDPWKARQFRETILKTINTSDLEPKFSFRFLTPEVQSIRLTREFFAEFTTRLVKLNSRLNVPEAAKNLSGRIKLLEGAVNEQGNISEEDLLTRVKAESPEGIDAELKEALAEFIGFFCQKSVEYFGKDVAGSALKETYAVLERKYGASTVNIFHILPEGSLEEEENRILNSCYAEFAEAVIDQITIDRLRNELESSFKNLSGGGGEKDVNASFAKFFEFAAEKLRLKVGHEEMDRIFENAYAWLGRKYVFFPPFVKILSVIPRGILEVPRFDTLSKDELERISKALKKMDLVKSEFTNIAAHELKTPLVPLKGYLERLLEDPKRFKLTPEVQEQLEICFRNAERLELLVSDILDVSKLDAGEMKFEMQEVDVGKLVRNVVSDFKTAANEKGLKLVSSVPKTLPKVEGDLQRLTQVLSNLVGNAVKFTDKGSIAVEAKAREGSVSVSVTDTGTGIRKEDIQRLFTKFFQVKEAETRKTRGTGLGLAVSKEIIRVHGGTIRAESPGHGAGSTFSFTLPAKTMMMMMERGKRIAKKSRAS